MLSVVVLATTGAGNEQGPGASTGGAPTPGDGEATPGEHPQLDQGCMDAMRLMAATGVRHVVVQENAPWRCAEFPVQVLELVLQDAIDAACVAALRNGSEHIPAPGSEEEAPGPQCWNLSAEEVQELADVAFHSKAGGELAGYCDENRAVLPCYADAQRAAVAPPLPGMYARYPWALIPGPEGCLYGLRDRVSGRTSGDFGPPHPQCNGVEVILKNWEVAAIQAECFAEIRARVASEDLHRGDPSLQRGCQLGHLLRSKAIDLALDGQCEAILVESGLDREVPPDARLSAYKPRGLAICDTEDRLARAIEDLWDRHPAR